MKTRFFCNKVRQFLLLILPILLIGIISNAGFAQQELYLHKIGPRYAQFYEPYAFLFYASYKDFSGTTLIDILFADANYRLPAEPGYTSPVTELFEFDANVIRVYWLSLGADPRYLDPDSPFYGEPEPTVSSLFGRDITIFSFAPIFKDPNFRVDISTGCPRSTNPVFEPSIGHIHRNSTFLWNATVAGFGSSGVEFEGIDPLPIDPFDGMPSYIPVYAHDETHLAVEHLGKPFIGPSNVMALEYALYYAGFSHWKGFSVLYFTPYIFEDIILTLEVSDGRRSDFETFPVSVVNYPVENYPPYIEDIEDQIFFVGRENIYATSVVDPDCMLFSLMVPPATNHVLTTNPYFRKDMDEILWEAELQGVPPFQQGDWMEDIINPYNGVITITPEHRGRYSALIKAKDQFGGPAVQTFSIFCLHPLSDYDDDGIINIEDNCPGRFNHKQKDTDLDGSGDMCDTDDDNDGVLDYRDICPRAANPDQLDNDADMVGNACDNCPEHPNPNQTDTDRDGIGDECDPDPRGPEIIILIRDWIGENKLLSVYTPPFSLRDVLPESAADYALTFEGIRADQIISVIAGDFNSDGTAHEIGLVLQDMVTGIQRLMIYNAPDVPDSILPLPMAGYRWIGNANQASNVVLVFALDFDSDGKNDEIGFVREDPITGRQSIMIYDAPVYIDSILPVPLGFNNRIDNVNGTSKVVLAFTGDFNLDGWANNIGFVHQNLISGGQRLVTYNTSLEVNVMHLMPIGSYRWIGDTHNTSKVILAIAGDFDFNGIPDDIGLVREDDITGNQNMKFHKAPESINQVITLPFSSFQSIGNANQESNVTLATSIF